MDVNAFKDRLRGGKLSRRQLQGALGAAGLTALAMPLSPARAATDLTLFEWNGYELPEFHPEYTARYGGEPEVSYFADEEEALQKMRAGFNVDLSHPCTASVGRWRDAGIIKPIDTTRIARWDEIIPDLFKPKGLVHEGQNYFMPWDFGYSAIGYNPAIIDVADPTFEIMVDPRFAGRVSMNAAGAGIVLLLLPGRWIDPGLFDWGLFAASGLFAGFAQFLMTSAFRVAPLSVVTPFEYMGLLWAIVLGMAVWNQPPGPWTLVGAGVIVLAGLYLVRRDALQARS